MKPALGYGDPVQSYAAYRASTAGGGYDTLTVPIDQLYNQFNYGGDFPACDLPVHEIPGEWRQTKIFISHRQGS